MKKTLLILVTFLGNYLPGGMHALAQSPIINSITPNNTSIQKFEKLELTVALTAGYANPYDYDDILIRGIFTAPSGKKDTIEGFYMQNYTLNTSSGNLTPTGSNNFTIRYAPAETGSYSYQVACINTLGSTLSAANSFQSVDADKKGFVRRNLSNYLKFDDGTQYIPIGQNLAWQQNNKYLNFKNWTDKLAANNANFIRVWQCSWGLGIEWRGAPYEGLKKYRQDNAFYTDKLLEECNAKDIYMMLCINHHGMVSSTTDPNWPDNPYNAVNGGPCVNTWDYFINATAKSLHKNRLRYIVARWGYSRNIMSWELFNEVTWTDQFNTYKTQIKDWHQEMAQYLKSKDPFRHLITTSYAHDDQDPATWNLPEIDFTQTHYYNGSPNVETVLVNGLKSYLGQFNKPTYTGEFGVNTTQSNLSTSDPNGIHIHNSVWATLFGGGMGAGSSWWWDSYIEPQNLYSHYKAPAIVAAKIELANQNYKPVAGTVTGGGNSDAAVSPGFGWGKAPAASFTIDATGSITPTANNLGEYIYGTQCKAAESNPPTFTVTFPIASQFSVRTSDISPYCNAQRVQIMLDGVEALNTLATANTTYTINVPSGSHTIKVDNAGGDWYRISGYTFSNLGTALNTYLLKSSDSKRAAGWVHNKKYNWIDAGPSGAVPPAVAGAVLSIPGITNGSYEVRWFECTNGTELLSSTVVVSNNVLQISCPSIAWDAAFTAYELSTLPIRLATFKGLMQSKKNLLIISIAESDNVKEITIERSKDGTVFLALGNLNQINNSYKGDHRFMDELPLDGKNFYRLKIMDKDGKFTYSGILLLENKNVGSFKIYPNPVTDMLEIKGTGANNQQYNACIFDNTGKKLLNKSVKAIDNKFTILLPVHMLASGNYYCIVTNGDGQTFDTKNFIKQ